MTNTVENLGKLERRVTISLPKEAVRKEVDSRIRQLAKKVKMPGFRPGKVPLKMVAQQYEGQVEAEVLSDKLGEEFFQLSRAEHLKLASRPHFAAKVIANDEVHPAHYMFDATFEVYPEVQVSELSALEITRTLTAIDDPEVERALEILRKQQARFSVRGEAGEPGGDSSMRAQKGDRITVDFVSEIKMDDGTLANHEKKDFAFVLGETQMPAEFENAVLGLTAGEHREFDLTFSDDYQNKEIVGKTAHFALTVKQVEWPSFPAIDADFAKSLGVEDGDLARMRAEIKENLQREADRCTQKLLKNQVMESLLKLAELEEVPKALVEQEQQRLVEIARQNFKQRDLLDNQQAAMLTEMFREEAKRRVKIALILAELAKQHDLQAKPEQIRAEIDEFAKSYADSKEVVHWYYADPSRLSEVEAHVTENNVFGFIIDRAQLVDKVVSFEELASASV